MLMGIVNVTPDSFSDGGKFLDPKQAIDHGLKLVADGAGLLDIGGESTRPYSLPVDTAEELRRVIPVVRGICEQSPVPVSIDTTKGIVAHEAIAAGVEIINDISGLTADPDMLRIAIETKAGVCAMHMQGTPQTMQDLPTYTDVVSEIYEYLLQRRNALDDAGVDPERVCLDPGIGFGKTHQHNLMLLSACHRFHDLERPILIGHSRKGFIAKVTGDKNGDQTAGTIGVALSLALQGVQVIRVHDVAAVHQALLLFEATGGMGEV